MSTVIRSVKRYVPWHGLYDPPYGRETTVRLLQWDNCYTINTDWSCMSGRADMTEAELIPFLGESYTTEEEAYRAALRRCPFAGKKANEVIRTEIIDNRKWHGDLVGDSRVADKYGVSVDHILAVARGEQRAPRLKEKV